MVEIKSTRSFQIRDTGEEKEEEESSEKQSPILSTKAGRGGRA